jgi:hypothetical protein
MPGVNGGLMKIPIRAGRITRAAALVPVLAALALAGCKTSEPGVRGGGGRDPAGTARERAARAVDEMNSELGRQAAEGDIFEPGIRAKIPSIGILRPSGESLASGEGYIPGMVRTTLNDNFRKFARGHITVTNIDEADEAALQEEVRKSLAGSSDELSLTSRIAARGLMTGKITKIADRRFNLDFSITDTETHEVLAGYNQIHSDIELTEGIAVNRLTEYFLGELGVRLNGAGKLALQGNSNEAGTALAKGRAAVEAGQGLEAMNYLYNAENFDITRQEAAGSLAAVQSRNREDLGAGARITDFFEKQDLWQGRLDEYNDFYRNHPPFELFYTPPVPVGMRGSGDSRAYDLRFKIGLRWNQNQLDVMERVLEEYILDELYMNSPGDIARWGLRGLPEDSGLFGGPGNFNYSLVINVENERGEVIVSGPMSLSGSLYRYNGRIYAACTQEFNAAFSGIKYVREQITDQIYIRIESINGIDIRTVGESGFMRVVQTQGEDLPPAQPDSLPQEFLASRQREIDEQARRERDASAARTRQEREAARAAERRKQEAARAAGSAERERNRRDFLGYFLGGPRSGTALTGGYIMGVKDAGTVNLNFFTGQDFWIFDLGLMFYPGAQKGLLSEDSAALPFGIDTGLSLCMEGNSWLLNAGGGVSFFLAWLSVDHGLGFDSDFFVIPYLKLSLDWRLFGNFFLRAGYRMDIYPAEKFYSYFESDSKKTVADKKLADNIFVGISLIH